MVGELYRRWGYAVEMCSGDGSDGGMDLRLHKDGRTTLVQCKHWQVYKAGVSPVRELFGILATGGGAQHAILVTTGRFTPDAQAFERGKPLDLIDGKQLRILLEASKYNADDDLLDVASWSADLPERRRSPRPPVHFAALLWDYVPGSRAATGSGVARHPTLPGKAERAAGVDATVRPIGRQNRIHLPKLTI